jgi:hypothetical protein
MKLMQFQLACQAKCLKSIFTCLSNINKFPKCDSLWNPGKMTAFFTLDKFSMIYQLGFNEIQVSETQCTET